jgi:hypothetical protein
VKNISIIILLLLLFNLSLISQNQQQEKPSSLQVQKDKKAEPPIEIQSKCATFFKTLIASYIEKAYDDILINSPIKKNKEQIQNLIDQTKYAINLYGQMKGFEYVNSETITPSYLRLRYLSLHSNFPMRWIFTYYNSPELGWIIVNLKFDDLTDKFFSD